MEQKENKKSKFIKCKKCGTNSILFICKCGNNLLKQNDKIRNKANERE